MKKLLIVFVFSTIIVSCNIFLPDNSDNDSDSTNDYTEMRLVFTRENEIWLYNMMNEELEKLIAMGDTIWTEESGFSFTRLWSDQARWSTDGKEIVFLEAVGTDGANLKVLNIETGEQRFFSNYVYRQDATPEWSTDGTKIVFAKSIVHLGLNYEIFIVDADGDNETQVTDRPQYSDGEPSLHRNGMDLLFSSHDNQIMDFPRIYHTALYEDWVTPLTPSDRVSVSAMFNPVTDEIIYGSKRTGQDNFQIWKVNNMEFINPVQLTDNNYNHSGWSWSNDGKLITFTRTESINGSYSNPEIWMMNGDGSEQTMILQNGSTPDLWVKE